MQSNDLQDTLNFILNENSLKMIKEIEKSNITTIDNALIYLYQNKSNLNTEEQDMIELFKTIQQYTNDSKETFEIVKKLESYGINSRAMLCEMDEKDLSQFGFNKQIFQQKCLPDAFKNFVEKKFNHKKISETIEKLIVGGIESEDQLFQLSEDIVQNKYLIPKYSFRKWKAEKQDTQYKSQAEQGVEFQNVQNQKQETPITSSKNNQKYQLKQKLNDLVSKLQKIQQKNGLNYYQYPLYKQQEIKDLQEYKTMIMIGQTGSGKTTLINFFLNYYLGVEFNDNFRIILINESNLGITKTQAISQTQDVTIYYVKPFNNNPGLRIIDTPGFGDTRGIQQDKIIADQIHECFEKTVDTLTTICFIVQASNARLTINQNYILSQILQMFGNDVIENFVFMFTFCDGQNPQAKQALEFKGDAQNNGCPIAEFIPKIPQPWYLKFNSSAFTASNNGEDVDMTQLFWNIGIKSFDQLIQKLKMRSDISLQLTRDVITERKKIINTIQHLRLQIQKLLHLMNEHQQTFKFIEQCDATMIDTKNFKIKQTKYKIEKIDLKQGEYVTNCITCNYTCHYPCCIPDDDNKSNCAAITNDYCTVCSNKCHWSVHKNMNFRLETTSYEDLVELSELKNKYLQSKSNKNQKEQILDGIENDYVLASIGCMDKQQELMHSINKLNKIALQPAVFKHEEEYLEMMIEEEKTKKDEGWQNRIETLQNMKDDWKLVWDIQTGTGSVKITQEFYASKIKSQKKQGLLGKLFS